MKKRTKRYDGLDGSMVEAGSGPSMDDNSGAAPVVEPEARPAPAAPKQRIVSKAELEKSGLSLRDFLNKERGLTRRGESTPAPTKSAPVEAARPTASPAASAEAPAKKEMYRTFGGKMAEKATDTSSADAAARREKIGSVMKGVGDYVRNMGKREEKHGTYVKDGKVVKYAKGGSVSKASSRADGIAQRGKTKGRMI